MIAILSGIVGLVGSLMPELIGLFRDYQDKKHELKILELQMEQQKLGHQHRIEEINVNADIAEDAGLRQYQPNSGISWIDGLNASVRPIVTYLLVFYYMAYKTSCMIMAYEVSANISFAELVSLSFREDDWALFSLVIGFWFGHRAFRKYLGK